MMKCFVIMPFGAEFNDVYSSIQRSFDEFIKSYFSVTSRENHSKHQCVRADTNMTTEIIVNEIIEGIQESDICVSDLTGNNPNVIWETGFAMGLNKPVVTITQDVKKLPFDLKSFRTLNYSRDQLKSSLESEEKLPKYLHDTYQMRFWPTGNCKTSEEWIREHLKKVMFTSSINRVYATDHIEPEIWSVPESYYWLALQGIRFLSCNFNSANETWEIVFSNAMYNAINTAQENFSRIAQENFSRITVNNNILNLGSSPFDITPGTNINIQEGIPKFEVARILIWERRFLTANYADDLIAVHKAYNVPLFFLPREKFSIDDLPNMEYLLCCESDHDKTTPSIKFNGSTWTKENGAFQPHYGFSRFEGNPLSNFHNLLQHRDLLFAIHARQIELMS